MFPEINLAPQGLRTKLTTQAFAFTQYCQQPSPGLILGLHPANERCHYKVTASLIGLAQTKNQPCSQMAHLT